MLEHGADLGLAVDGDADRCLAVDASGAEVDGDQLMAILALAMRDAGTLTDNTLVATVMSNLGLKIAMREAGIELVEATVGDRYVLEELRARAARARRRAERPRRHARLRDHRGRSARRACRCGADGADRQEPRRAGERRDAAAAGAHQRPGGRQGRDPGGRASLAAVAAAEAQLGATGRVLLRPSGTEQLVRVMVEASAADIAQKIAEGLAAEVRSASPVA